MADMRIRASIQATVALGQKLAGLLQTLVELNPSSQSDLKDVHYDVETTSGTLRQILDMYALGLGEDFGFKRDTKSVVTSAYLDDIEKLAVKCGLIYKSIILVTQKAGARGSSKEEDDKASSVENLKNELLTGPIPDPSSFKWVKLVKIPTVYDQREWLEPRFERLQEQLQWIRTGLLIHLHVFKLALLQNGSVERNTGAFENELIYRSSIQLLRRRQVKFTKKKAKKQEKAQRQCELRRKADKSETASLASDASSVRTSTTTSTVVDNDTSPNGGSTVVKGVEIIDSEKVGPWPAHKDEQTSAMGTKQGEAKQLSSDKVTTVEARDDKSKIPRSFTWDSRLSSDLPAWLFDFKQRVFGSDDKFKTDWPSNTLEAWIYHDSAPGNAHTRLPFGHKRLQYGLNKVLKDGKSERSTWNRYLETSKLRRTGLDHIVDEANRQQSRERVCIAFQEYGKGWAESFMVVFLSIRKEPKTISFKDAIGRHYTLPFETCRKWDSMRETLIQAFNHIDVIGPHVIEGHFDLKNSNGDVILPHLWNTTIMPGDAITMIMWPSSIPVRGFYGPPPFVPNPLNGSEAMRMSRLRHLQQLRMNAMRQQGLLGPPPVFPPPPMMMSGMPPHPPPGGQRFRPREMDIVSMSSVSEYDISEKEDEQLMFVDFVEELEKTASVTVTDVLRKFTTMKDVIDEDSLGDLLNADSDYDSDSSTSTSSSSEIIND